jgi:Flp pilus assembly protein TadG
MISLRAYFRDRRGASAVEFALVIPVAMMLILSTLHMSMVIYAESNLNFAAEETARCIAMANNNPSGTTGLACATSPTAANVQSYGAARYVGPNISPTFSLGVSTNAACSVTNQICATGTYNMSMGFTSIPIAISAKAYYAHS